MMRKSPIFVFVLLVAALALSQAPVFAVDVAQGNICGRVYHSDMKTPYEKGEVRAVNAETGEAKSGAVGKDGCYCVKGATIGNYSVSYSDGTTEFMLADKLNVQNKVTLAACLATGEGNVLSL